MKLVVPINLFTLSLLSLRTAVKQDIPALDVTYDQDAHWLPGVLVKHKSHLLLVLCLNDEKNVTAVGQWPTHEHNAICEQFIYERGMFAPVGLFAHGLALRPRRARATNDSEGGFHRLGLGVCCLFMNVLKSGVADKAPRAV